MCCRKRGQSTVEFAVFTCAVVSAILMMAVYMKRAIAGGLRSAADAIGEQYEPGKTTGQTVTVHSGGKTVTTTKLVPRVIMGKNVLVSQSTTRMSPQVTRTSSHEEVGPLGTDLWK